MITQDEIKDYRARRKTLPDALDAALNGLLPLPAAFIVCGYRAPFLRLWEAAVFMLICGGMWLLRRYVRRARVFFPAHILLAAMPLAFPGVADKIAYCAAALVILIVSWAKRLKEEQGWFGREALALSLLMDFAAYYMAGPLDCPDLRGAALALVVLSLPMFIVLQSIRSADATSGEALSGQTAIAAAHRRWLAGFAAFAAGVAAVCSQSGAGAAVMFVVNSLLAALKALLTFLFSLLPLAEDAGGGEPPHVERDTPAEFLPGLEETPPNPILDAVAMALTALILLAVAAALGYTLYRFVRLMLKRFGEGGDADAEDYREEAAEAAARAKRGRGNRPRLLDMSLERRARALFVKTVRKARITPEPGQTAREIARNLQKDRPTLVSVYEKARYGGGRLTRAEYLAARKDSE